MKVYHFHLEHDHHPVVLSFSITAATKRAATDEARRIMKAADPITVTIKGVDLKFEFSALPITGDIIDSDPA